MQKRALIKGSDFSRCLEFRKELHIVFEIVSEVVHSPFEHRDAFKSHTEGVSAVLVRVYSACFQHIGINHTAAQNLQPTGAFAHIAALSVADVATYVHLGRRLCEGEVGRPHTDLGLGPEHLAGKEKDYLFEVGKTYIFIDVQSFNLMEDAVGAGADGLVAEHSSGADDPDGDVFLSIVLTCTLEVWVRSRSGLG